LVRFNCITFKLRHSNHPLRPNDTVLHIS
jgi:hypothetical protein